VGGEEGGAGGGRREKPDGGAGVAQHTARKKARRARQPARVRGPERNGSRAIACAILPRGMWIFPDFWGISWGLAG